MIDNIVEDEEVDLEDEAAYEAEEETKPKRDPKDMVVEVTAENMWSSH